jgi:hypothetical protein
MTEDERTALRSIDSVNRQHWSRIEGLGAGQVSMKIAWYSRLLARWRGIQGSLLEKLGMHRYSSAALPGTAIHE